MKTEMHNCYICAEALVPSRECSLFDGSVSGLLWAQVSFLVVSLTLWLFQSFLPALPQDFPKLCLMFGCGFLCVGCIYARYLSASVAEHH